MKLIHQKLICSILALSFFVSVPLAASANQDPNFNDKKDSAVHDSSMNDENEDQNSIALLKEGKYCTTQPIQVIEAHKKADANYNLLSGFGDILYQKSIVIDGVENSLLFTFENPNESLKLAKTKCDTILKILAKKYSLDELNNDNWKEYRTAIDYYMSDPDSNKMYDEQGSLLKQFQSLEAFLDTYENSILNNEVIDFVSLANTKLRNHTISKIVLDDMIGHLPDTDSLVKKKQNSLTSTRTNEPGKISPNQISGLTNITAANEYALQYAESPNSEYIYYNRGDCTNFVSQICKEGGVPQDGYWHSNYFYTGAIPTKAWTVASEFAKYWKPRWYTGLTKEHFLDFSKQLYTKGGSVIGMDTSGNKVYHHLAYVTQRANNQKTRYGRTFYDFFITQHSDDYACWASDNSGRAKGWLSQPDGTIYAIFS